MNLSTLKCIYVDPDTPILNNLCYLELLEEEASQKARRITERNTLLYALLDSYHAHSHYHYHTSHGWETRSVLQPSQKF